MNRASEHNPAIRALVTELCIFRLFGYKENEPEHFLNNMNNCFQSDDTAYYCYLS
ncbi:hypothetical protein VQ7734_02826 [Vibrio quintilis]|uniref:Uncharacterized protein n=1 Tax=Vibrio quintilis TaxID=1117707 RepID=A0A1M7YWM3_9VIBR|nr:hypothetical protein VQ7734_02826 [Vibrio quintilis]